MNYLKKKELLIGLLSFVLFLISSGLAIYFYFDKDECICNDVSINTSPEVSDATKKIKLEVKGEVKKPGVYEVSSDSIIQDVIDLSGGLTKNANTNNINLSMQVKNEMVIYVYKKNATKSVTKTINVCKCPTYDISSCTKKEESVIVPSEGATNNEISNEVASDTKTSIVNINTASISELKTLAGIGESKAKAIISYREKNGGFKSREELKKVSGMDDKIFEQSAGFLRIFGNNPLDKTNIHPEDYEIVNKILSDNNIDVKLVGTKEMESKLASIKDEAITSKYNISIEKWESFKNNLVSGVIDPRDDVKQMTLRSDVLTIDDLELNMSLEGTVRNVTSFGAFVDIGVHQDGLVHISQMSAERRIEHPLDIVSVGDIVDVRVIDVDTNKGRISLSMILDEKEAANRSYKNNSDKNGDKKNNKNNGSRNNKNNAGRKSSKQQGLNLRGLEKFMH